MRFRIRNELTEFDYRRLIEFLRINSEESIKLFPGFFDLPFMSVDPLTIALTPRGYVLATEIFLEDPIGVGILKDLASDAKIAKCLDIGNVDVRFENIATGQGDLEGGINLSIRTLERIINCICAHYDRMLDLVLSVNSTWLDKQFDLQTKEEEAEKRGEKPTPYGVIHANGTRDAESLAGNLVPVYIGRDKTYLFNAKKLFRLLPRDFVRRLFSLTGPSLTPERNFSEEEREILDEFVRWGYLKKQTIMKTVYYFGLDSRTEKHLLASLYRLGRS